LRNTPYFYKSEETKYLEKTIIRYEQIRKKNSYYLYMSGGSIITFTPTSGSSNGNVFVTIVVAGLPAGGYVTSVRFGSNSASNVSYSYQSSNYIITCLTPASSSSNAYIYVSIVTSLGDSNLVSWTPFIYTNQATMMPPRNHVLTPTFGMGSYGRTGPAMALSNHHSKIGSQSRIYSFYNSRGLGQQYQEYLIKVLGLNNHPRVNRWSMMNVFSNNFHERINRFQIKKYSNIK